LRFGGFGADVPRAGNDGLVRDLLGHCVTAGRCTVVTGTPIKAVRGGAVAGATATPRGYVLEAAGGTKAGPFDAVVVATPLERAGDAGIRFELADGTPVPQPGALRPFAETYATVVRGVLDPAFFGGASVVGQDECNLV